jgi:hypothetical protein
MSKETANQSSYFVVGNLTFTKDEIKKLPTQVINEIEVEFPYIFRRHTGDRYIKFIGCSLSYIQYNGSEKSMDNEMVYNPIHTTLHSNIVDNNTTESVIDKSKLVVYESDELGKILFDNNDHKFIEKPSHINEYTDYILTVNNFFNQKIYKIPQTIDKLKFYFVDEQGERVNVLQINHYLSNEVSQDYIDWYNKPDEEKGDEPAIYESNLYFFQALFKIEMELII